MTRHYPGLERRSINEPTEPNGVAENLLYEWTGPRVTPEADGAAQLKKTSVGHT